MAKMLSTKEAVLAVAAFVVGAGGAWVLTAPGAAPIVESEAPDPSAAVVDTTAADEMVDSVEAVVEDTVG